MPQMQVSLIEVYLGRVIANQQQLIENLQSQLEVQQERLSQLATPTNVPPLETLIKE